MKDYVVSRSQIGNMKHCIGFDNFKIKGTKYRKMTLYRNYYTTGEPNESLDDLVNKGLMERVEFKNGCGENPQMYLLSKEGFEFLSEITEVEFIQ